MTKKKKKLSVRQKAARRTTAGGFNKAVFKRIGGKDCLRYAALTWKERNNVHDEIPAVKARSRALHVRIARIADRKNLSMQQALTQAVHA